MFENNDFHTTLPKWMRYPYWVWTSLVEATYDFIKSRGSLLFLALFIIAAVSGSLVFILPVSPLAITIYLGVVAASAIPFIFNFFTNLRKNHDIERESKTLHVETYLAESLNQELHDEINKLECELGIHKEQPQDLRRQPIDNSLRAKLARLKQRVIDWLNRPSFVTIQKVLGRSAFAAGIGGFATYVLIAAFGVSLTLLPILAIVGVAAIAGLTAYYLEKHYGYRRDAQTEARQQARETLSEEIFDKTAYKHQLLIEKARRKKTLLEDPKTVRQPNGRLHTEASLKKMTPSAHKSAMRRSEHLFWSGTLTALNVASYLYLGKVYGLALIGGSATLFAGLSATTTLAIVATGGAAAILIIAAAMIFAMRSTNQNHDTVRTLEDEKSSLIEKIRQIQNEIDVIKDRTGHTLRLNLPEYERSQSKATAIQDIDGNLLVRMTKGFGLTVNGMVPLLILGMGVCTLFALPFTSVVSISLFIGALGLGAFTAYEYYGKEYRVQKSIDTLTEDIKTLKADLGELTYTRDAYQVQAEIVDPEAHVPQNDDQYRTVFAKDAVSQDSNVAADIRVNCLMQ